MLFTPHTQHQMSVCRAWGLGCGATPLSFTSKASIITHTTHPSSPPPIYRSSLIGADIEIIEIAEVDARREAGGRLRHGAAVRKMDKPHRQPPFPLTLALPS